MHSNKINVKINVQVIYASLLIELIEEGRFALITSSVVEFELKKTPDPERISFGSNVLSLHSERIGLSDKMINHAKEFERRNIKPIDALHLAIADIEKIDYLCTCDDRFLRSAKKIENLNTKVVSPIEFIEEYER